MLAQGPREPQKGVCPKADGRFALVWKTVPEVHCSCQLGQDHSMLARAQLVQSAEERLMPFALLSSSSATPSQAGKGQAAIPRRLVTWLPAMGLSGPTPAAGLTDSVEG